MRVEVTGKKIKLDDDLKTHIDRRLSFALKKFNTDIERIEVSLSDENGPRGGIDKRCLIVVKLLRSLGRVTIEDHGKDFFTVVSRAADRISRAVSRALDRKRDKKYQQRRLASQDDADADADADAEQEDSD